MIFEEEVPVFPSGVSLEDSWIIDTVTGDRVRINETARRMLSLVDGRRPAREIGGAVAASYGLAPHPVVSDFLQLAARLNEKYLLNVDTPPRSWLVVLAKRLRLFLTGIALGHLSLPLHRKRLELCSKSRPIAFLSVVRRIGLPATLVGWTLSLSVWLLLGDVFPSFWTVVIIAGAFALSLVLHEAAHAMVLVPVPAYLSVHGPIFLVGHPRIPPGKGFMVAVAGPVITGVSGLLVVLTSGLLSSEYLVFAGEILTLNLLGITTIAADGRKALRNLALVLDPSERGGVQC
jgi:hypothetical protein